MSLPWDQLTTRFTCTKNVLDEYLHRHPEDAIGLDAPLRINRELRALFLQLENVYKILNPVKVEVCKPRHRSASSSYISMVTSSSASKQSEGRSSSLPPITNITTSPKPSSNLTLPPIRSGKSHATSLLQKHHYQTQAPHPPVANDNAILEMLMQRIVRVEKRVWELERENMLQKDISCDNDWDNEMNDDVAVAIEEDDMDVEFVQASS